MEKITDYIIHAKQTIDNLEDHRQDILRKKQQAWEGLNTTVAELEKYGKEIPLIERIKQLETELDKKIDEKSYRTLSERLARDVEMVDNQNIEYSHWLSQSYKELEESSENRGLKPDIYNIKSAEKQLAKEACT